MRRALAPGLLVALLLLPSWLGIASAQAPEPPALPGAPVEPPDPVARALQDLLAGVEHVQRAAGEAVDVSGTPRVDVGAVQRRAERLEGQVDRAAEEAPEGPIRRVFYEGFEGGTLQELGWGQEVLRGDAPWGIADEANQTVVRASGAVFATQDDAGENLTQAKDGHRAASIVGKGGVYDRRVDARLISPVIDLRDVVGASLRTDDPYEAVLGDPALKDPYQQLVALWKASPAGGFSWVLTTPPSKLQRLSLPYPADAARTCVLEPNPVIQGDPDDVLGQPCMPVTELGFNPLSARYGAALVNLTFYHKYSFAPDESAELPGSRLDGAFLEVRVVHPDGSTGPWEYLTGDAVFEPSLGDNTTSVGLPYSPSGAAEFALGTLADSNDYDRAASPYNGRVQLRDPSACWSGDVQCVSDVPAWVGGSDGMWKSHFTLNGWAGHQVQVAWRVHSAVPAVQKDHFGWFLDAVQVEALLPKRDPGVHELVAPRPGDVVPQDAFLVPTAVVRNHGHQPVEHVLVNFTIETLPPAYGPQDAQAGLGRDAEALNASLQENPPRVAAPQTPGEAKAAVEAQARPVVVLRTNVTVPLLGPQEQVEVRSPLACTACPPGAYVLRVEASLPLLGAGDGPGVPDDRVDDGRPGNNNLTAPFKVRDVRDARVTLAVPPSHLLTDIGEPKVVRVELENLGNQPLQGVVEVTARQLDPAGQPVPGVPALPVGSVGVGPGDLPAGRRLSSYGGERDRYDANVTWVPVGLPPAVYRLEAVFKASPPLAAPPRAVLASYVRATPAAYHLEDFEIGPAEADGFGNDRIQRVNFTSAAWRNVYTDFGIGVRLGGFHQVPVGGVSTSRVWNGTADDRAILEAYVLTMLGQPGVQALLFPGELGLPPLPGVPGDSGVPHAVLQTFPLNITYSARVTSAEGSGLADDPGASRANVSVTVRWPRPSLAGLGLSEDPFAHWPPELEAGITVATGDITVPAGVNVSRAKVTAENITVKVPSVRYQSDNAQTTNHVITTGAGLVRVAGLQVDVEGAPLVTLDTIHQPIAPVRQKVTLGGIPNQDIDLNATFLYVRVGPATPGAIERRVDFPPGTSTEVRLTNVALGPDQGSVDVQRGDSAATPGTKTNTSSVQPPSEVITVINLVRNTVAGAALPNSTVAVALVFYEHNVTACILAQSNANPALNPLQVALPTAVGTCPGESSSSTTVTYQELDRQLGKTIATDFVGYNQHSLLDDYYLGRRVDLRGCLEPCRPVLSFWHRANFTWEGAPREVALPGALGGPAKVPGGIQAVSPDHAQENRSRGLVEVTVLNTTTLDPNVPVRHDLQAGATLDDAASAPERVGQQGLDADLCALAPQACDLPCQALPGTGAGAVPLLGQWYDERLRARNVCPSDLVTGDPPTARALAAFEQPVPQWRREVVDLSAYRGREVYLDFHLQTTLGRFQTAMANPRCQQPAAGQNLDLPRCFGQPIDHWNLDNIRLADVRPDGSVLPLRAGDAVVGFLDTAGDANDPSWANWSSIHTMRDALQANVALHPSCFASLARPVTVGTTQDVPSESPLLCLAASRLRGPAAAVLDGRGWSVYDHSYNYEHPNDQPILHPYWDGWLLDDLAGFLPPGAPTGPTSALRFGGPGATGRYPADELYRGKLPDDSQLYTISSSPLLDLQASSRPFAEFQTNYTFSGDLRKQTTDQFRDGGAVFLDRYARDAAGRYVFDDRVILLPEGGYDLFVDYTYGAVSNDGIALNVSVNWTPLDAEGEAVRNNAFGGASGGWRTARFDLLAGLKGLCTLEVTDGAGSAVRTFDRDDCPDLLDAANYTCALDTCVHVGGLRYRNITAFEQDRDALYALSFHAQTGAPAAGTGSAFGWVIDDLRVGEELLANDLGISHVLVPAPGKFVGPGQPVQPKVNVTNHGFFHQRGARLHFNVTQDTGQVFPHPTDAARNPPGCDLQRCTLQAPSSTLFEGHRTPGADHNETLTFGNEWVPEVPGLYTLNVMVELAGEPVGATVIPIQDENPANDLFRQVVDVRETHSVRLLPPAELPDEEVVRPLVGTLGAARELRITVENTGTMPTGTSEDRAVTVEVTITDEAGRTETLEQPVDPMRPGQQTITRFGEAAWKPLTGGVYTLHFRVHHPLDRQPADDERVVAVQVLTSLVPAPGRSWAEAFAPEGEGWSNATRRGFAAGQGWSFGDGAQYAPNTQGSLVLQEPVDLTTFRDAVLALEHSYDFERKYDGGVVEVSPDGLNWQVVEPLGGYPDNLTSASPGAGAPGEERRAFTGTSDGVVRSVIPLGTVNLTRTEPGVVFEETFDHGTLLQAEELAQGRGQWVEIVSRTPPPLRPDGTPAQAWWVNKTLVWRHVEPLINRTEEQDDGDDKTTWANQVLERGLLTLEGSKELRVAQPIRLPDRDGTVVVEFDEWRALGLAQRGSSIVPTTFRIPNNVEVAFAPAEAGAGQEVPVLARGATAQRPYSDNYLDWTRRTILVPARLLEKAGPGDLNLVFRLYLASGNSEPGPGAIESNANAYHGGGGAEDTDLISPHLGWAIANPSVSYTTTRERCEAAGYTYAGSRCLLWQDPLAYQGTDDPAARANWTAGWRTERHRPSRAPEVLASSQAKASAGGDPFLATGWQLVDAVGDLGGGKPVWDKRALAPPRSGHGRVAEARGGGQDARLVSPLDLRGATGDVALSFDHSFKFSDLFSGGLVPILGASSGGRVEVSRDGGRTWEPLAPVTTATAPDGYSQELAGMGLRRMYMRGTGGTPCSLQLCLDPADPYAAPGGWPDAATPTWAPFPAQSAHSPLGGAERDPERNSGFGVDSVAFSGTTCSRRMGSQDATTDLTSAFDYLFTPAICEGPEGWRTVRFDLTPYAGQQVLLGFHAWFTSHRCAKRGCSAVADGNGNGLPDDPPARGIPADFWRVDNVRVEGRVLDGKPLHVRLRAFSDGTGERYGWDIVNATLLGGQHLRNLAVRVEEPAAGAPLGAGMAQARVLNRGQEPAQGRATVYVEAAEAVPLLNGSFERPNAALGGILEAWRNGTLDPPAPLVAAGNLTTTVVAAGAHALRQSGDGSKAEAFRVYQDLDVPGGNWTLVGLADVRAVTAGATPSAALLTLQTLPGETSVAGQGVFADAGQPDAEGLAPPVTFELPINRTTAGDGADEVRYREFAFNFTVRGEGQRMRLNIQGEPFFRGVLHLDALRIVARPPAGFEPAWAPLRNAGFEHGDDAAQGHTLQAGDCLRDPAAPGALASDGPPTCNWVLVRGQAKLLNATLAGRVLDHPGPVTSVMPEGQRALALEGLGVGQGDFELLQTLDLDAGKYRLSGLYGTRGVNRSLTRDDAGPEVAAAGALEQTVRAADLPRNLTGVRLWGSATGMATITLLDTYGRQLWQVSGALGGGTLLPLVDGPFAMVPLDAGNLTLRVTGTNLKLQARAGDEYPHGKLTNGGAEVAGSDLRVTFAGPVNLSGGRAELRAGRGAHDADPQVVLWPVPTSAEYHLRQVVDVPPEVRQVTNLSVSFEGPPGYQQGFLRARLFDPQGQPLSAEVPLDLTNYTNTAALGTGPITVQLNLSRAFLPPNTTQVHVGFRADNLTGLKLRASFHDRPLTAAAPAPDAGLWWRDPSTDTWQVATALNASRGAQQALDLNLNLTYRREGAVRVFVDGAEAAPLLLEQPTSATTVLTDAHRGGHAFQLDFVVPGHRPVNLTIRGDQFQGAAVLDALRLEPLTMAGTTLDVALAPGASAVLEAPAGPVQGARYAVRAAVVTLDGQGAPVPEMLLADNRAARVTSPALGPGRLVPAGEAFVEAAPNNLDLGAGQPVALRVHARNAGAEGVEVASARITVTSPSKQVVFQATHADFDPLPPDLRVPALEERTFAWAYQPEVTLAAGVYTVQAELRYLRPDGEEPVLAGSAPLYLGTNFHKQFAKPWPVENNSFIENLGTRQDEHADPAGPAEHMYRHRWTSDAKWYLTIPKTCDDAGADQVCTPGMGFTDEGLSNAPYQWFWRRTAAVNNSASRSFTLGAEAASMPCWPQNNVQNGQTPTTTCPGGDGFTPLWGTIFAALRSPLINITDMGKPKVVWADRHQFPRGVAGDLFARVARPGAGGPADLPGYVTFPANECLTKTQDGADGWVNLTTTQTGETTGFRAQRFVAKSADLLGPVAKAWAADSTEATPGPFDPDAWTHVQVCWRLQQTSTHANLGGQLMNEWSIDDIVVTPFAMDMGPTQHWPIGDNVTKDFRVLLRNDGAYTDTYRVELVDEAGQPSRVPGNWRVEVLEPDGRMARDVRLQPGEARELTVRVHVDVAPVTMAREGSVDLVLTAVSHTFDLLRRSLHLAFDFEYPERSNLRVAGVIVNDAGLSVDKPRTVDALIQNTGAMPVEGARVAILDKMDPSFGVAPEELRRLDGQPLEPFDLAPGDVKVVTANWIPRVPGEHNLTIVVDPEARILEFDEHDNVLVRPIEVPRAEFPDLVVEAAAGAANPVPGDAVEVTMRVTNQGGAPALGVQVSLRAGVADLLPGEPPHVLPKAIFPGESVTVNATWKPAFAGEQTLIGRARTFAGILEKVETLDDNQDVLLVKVRSRGLELPAPEPLAAEPGSTVLAELTVHNRGDVGDTYALEVLPPEDWRAELVGLGDAPRVAVGNHSSAILALRIGPPAHAEAGPWDVRVRARSENSTEAAEASVVVRVPQRFGVRFALEPELLLQPGERFLPVTLENSGNGPDVVTVRARQAPDGWRFEPATFTIPARTTAGVRLNASLPTGTPEAAYEVVLEAQGKDGALLTQRAAVLVLPLERLRVALEGVPAQLLPGQAVQGTLVVHNEGNLPARANLSLALPEGWSLRLERDVVQMEPGEARRIGLGFVVPDNATARLEPLRALALSGRGAPFRLDADVRVARADLALLEAELLPRGQVREGAIMTLQVRVQNRGDLAAAAPVAVFLDDQLVGFEAVPALEPGAEARVQVQFRAPGGEHVVLATVDPGREVGEEDETNNARLLVHRADGAAGLFATPGPEAGLLALAMVAAAVALRGRPRRRMRP